MNAIQGIGDQLEFLPGKWLFGLALRGRVRLRLGRSRPFITECPSCGSKVWNVLGMKPAASDRRSAILPIRDRDKIGGDWLFTFLRKPHQKFPNDRNFSGL